MEINRILKEKFKIDQLQLNSITRTLLTQAVKVKTKGEIPTVCRDKDDNNVLWLASSCSADLIITGDKDLLTLINFEGTKIIHPSEFIKSINN